MTRKVQEIDPASNSLQIQARINDNYIRPAGQQDAGSIEQIASTLVDINPVLTKYLTQKAEKKENFDVAQGMMIYRKQLAEGKDLTGEEIKAEIKNNDVIAGIKKLKEQIKDLKKEVETAQSQTSAPISEEVIGDTKVVVAVVENGDLKKIVDDMKNANEKLAILLLQAKDDKVLIVAGSKNTNIKAGEWIKNIAPIVGGGGGGRPDFAQAGGKDVTKVEDAKIAALTYAKENL